MILSANKYHFVESVQCLPSAKNHIAHIFLLVARSYLLMEQFCVFESYLLVNIDHLAEVSNTSQSYACFTVVSVV